MPIADNLRSKSLGLSARQMSSISESPNHVQRVATSPDLKQKLLSLVGTPVQLLFKGYHTNDLEASNDTWGKRSALWRFAKSRVDNNPTLYPTLYYPPTSSSITAIISQPTTISGILCAVAPNGARIVPSSRRANGTIRPEIGIRPPQRTLGHLLPGNGLQKWRAKKRASSSHDMHAQDWHWHLTDRTGLSWLTR